MERHHFGLVGKAIGKEEQEGLSELYYFLHQEKLDLSLVK
jgi:hypothetical protein